MITSLYPKLNPNPKKINLNIKASTNSAAATANRQLSDALDLAYLKVISGAFTPQDAVFDAVKKLGADGIKCVRYEPKRPGRPGRTDQLDVAVRRAVITGVGKTCGDLQLGLSKEMDCTLVEVSSHLGARPSHAEWQGQIYSLVKDNPKYPYFYDATGYGTGNGLCGWNCRHSFFPYFEGLSTPANEPDFSSEENEKAYRDEQKQRGYERAIRKSKRELAALDGARSSVSDPAKRAKFDREFERKSVTLKRREARLSEHLKSTGLLPDNSRVRVDGFNKSVSQKAVHAAKKELDKYKGYHYNKNGNIIVTDDWKSKNKPTIKKDYKPYAVIETQTVNKNGDVQIDRSFYDKNGKLTKQVHSGDHGKPKMHPYGKHGEHKHNYEWNPNQKHPNRITEELNDFDRKENSDIL